MTADIKAALDIIKSDIIPAPSKFVIVSYQTQTFDLVGPYYLDVEERWIDVNKILFQYLIDANTDIIKGKLNKLIAIPTIKDFELRLIKTGFCC